EVERRATSLATPVWKVDAACLNAAAAQLDLPIIGVKREELVRVMDRIVTHSDISQAATGLGSAAEAAALAAAGPGARLTLARIASAHATCALAEGNPS
ncbi:MAG: cobalamin biosynthesis protein, partial [Steroidobacteraceae bacterium]